MTAAKPRSWSAFARCSQVVADSDYWACYVTNGTSMVSACPAGWHLGERLAQECAEREAARLNAAKIVGSAPSGGPQW